jgi:hypothetical protein
MGAQDPARLQKFQQKYDDLVELEEVPYHYGTHYSCQGLVLGYQMRVEPFTQLYLEFHDDKFVNLILII